MNNQTARYTSPQQRKFEEANQVRFVQPPVTAGAWLIAGAMHVPVHRKPRWLTRKLCGWLFEWRWIDNWPL